MFIQGKDLYAWILDFLKRKYPATFSSSNLISLIAECEESRTRQFWHEDFLLAVKRLADDKQIIKTPSEEWQFMPNPLTIKDLEVLILNYLKSEYPYTYSTEQLANRLRDKEHPFKSLDFVEAVWRLADNKEINLTLSREWQFAPKEPTMDDIAKRENEALLNTPVVVAQELGLYYCSTFGDAVKAHTWGTLGPDGQSPLKQIRLIDASTDHLENIIATQGNISEITRRVILRILRDRRLPDKTMSKDNSSPITVNSPDVKVAQVEFETLDIVRARRVVYLRNLQDSLNRIIEKAVKNVRQAKSKNQIKKATAGLDACIKETVDLQRGNPSPRWDLEITTSKEGLIPFQVFLTLPEKIVYIPGIGHLVDRAIAYISPAQIFWITDSFNIYLYRPTEQEGMPPMLAMRIEKKSPEQ
jgi:hypothetical protein